MFPTSWSDPTSDPIGDLRRTQAAVLKSWDRHQHVSPLHRSRIPYLLWVLRRWHHWGPAARRKWMLLLSREIDDIQKETQKWLLKDDALNNRNWLKDRYTMMDVEHRIEAVQKMRATTDQVARAMSGKVA